MGIRKPRPEFDPNETVRAVCPGCALRHGTIVVEDCQVCDGQGVITLGRPALMYDTPEAVAHAISIVLESAASLALTDEHRARLAPRVVPEAVARMVRLGLLERPGGTP